jgi:phosphoglycerol transferase MdoB-like AlkP superfamily enzyme
MFFNNLELTEVQFDHIRLSAYGIEMITIFLCLIVFWFSGVKSFGLRLFLSFYPILATYIVIEVYIVNLDRVPRISDLENLMTLADLSPGHAIALIAIVMLYFPVVFFLLYLNRKTIPFRWLFYWPNCLSLVGLFLLWQFYGNDKYRYIHFNEKSSVALNGRISSLIYYTDLENRNFEKIRSSHFSSKSHFDFQFKGDVVDRRNVYVVVLESFIDPRLLEGFSFDKSPLNPALKNLFIEKDFSFSFPLSPSYGGRTAQAEFELLSGLPALAKVNSIEFNVMQGGVVDSFVRKLSQEGYSTRALISTNASYFNSRQAYRSLGFDRVDYLAEMHGDLNVEGDVFLFDGVLLDQVFRASHEKLAQNEKPFFFYALGIYGHREYYRNLALRPDVVKPSPFHEDVNKIANQFYYRTEAVARFLNKMKSIDPDSIVLLISDHLPAIKKISNYSHSLYANICIFKSANEIIDLSGMKYYNIPSKIWSILDGSGKTDHSVRDHHEDLYFSLLKQSLESP